MSVRESHSEHLTPFSQGKDTIPDYAGQFTSVGIPGSGDFIRCRGSPMRNQIPEFSAQGVVNSTKHFPVYGGIETILDTERIS